MKNKFLTILLAVAIAICLWVYVISVERPESENTYYNVPVVLDGVDILQDRGMMITSNTNMTVTLKLSGRRTDLNNLKSSDIAAVVDLSRISGTGEKKLSYDVSIPGTGSVEVVSRQPETVSLTVTQWDTAEVPVEVVYENRNPEYYVDQTTEKLDYNTVTVTGPKDIIEQIKKAKITIDLQDRTESISESRRYALCDEDGNPIEDVSTVTTDRGEIRVSVSIQQLKEIKLDYTVLDGGGLTSKNVTVTADYDSVTVAGSAAALQDLEEINLGSVDLSTLTENTELVMPIKLPEGVSNRSGYTVVRLKVEMPELETRSFTVSQFRADHVPQGMAAQISNIFIEVKIRAHSAVLDQLQPEQITAVVDMAGEEAGTFSLPVQFEFEGVASGEIIGAIGKYSVTGKLTEAVPEPDMVTEQAA